MRIFAIIIILIGLQAQAQVGGDFLDSGQKNPLPGVLSDKVINNLMCEGELQVKDHMAQMGFLIRGLREMVDNIVKDHKITELRNQIMVDSQMIRTHLSAVLPKTAMKIKHIDPKNIQVNKLIYQRYLNRLISLTIDLESELIEVPVTPDQIQSQSLKVAETIIEIDETVESAHKKFRF